MTFFLAKFLRTLNKKFMNAYSKHFVKTVKKRMHIWDLKHMCPVPS